MPCFGYSLVSLIIFSSFLLLGDDREASFAFLLSGGRKMPSGTYMFSC